MRVLLVKLSSMGDVIHTLPALTDALKFLPDVKFTWLIDAGFQEIAHWHPAVDMVIPIELRDRNLKNILATVKRLRLKKYDLIIDAQGLLKSALLARAARGKRRVGYDKNSSREAISSYFYDKKIAVSRDLHAVMRMRQLFARAFGYDLPHHMSDYGIDWSQIVTAPQTEQPYLVFLHGTTWDSKHWPEAYWFQLAEIAAKQDLKVQVTWATPEQKARAQRLSAYATNVEMLPHLTLQQALSVLYHSKGAVAVDTGFAHLAAAIAKPTVAIYGATDPKKSGTDGARSINLGSTYNCAPCMRRVCSIPMNDPVFPPCYKEITPQLVWQRLSNMLSKI